MANKNQETEQIRTILVAEMDLLEKITKLEQQKRVYILGIRSELIQKNCLEQEILQKKIVDSNNQKELLLKKILPGKEINLTQLVLYCDENTNIGKELSIIAQKYRKLAEILQKMIAENQLLLVQTNASVQRLMQNLRENLAADLELGYAPSGTSRQKSGSSVFINANA